MSFKTYFENVQGNSITYSQSELIIKTQTGNLMMLSLSKSLEGYKPTLEELLNDKSTICGYIYMVYQNGWEGKNWLHRGEQIATL